MGRLRTIARGFVILLAAAALPVAGEVASLVADLHQGSGPNPSPYLSSMVRIGGKVVFFAIGSAGSGLWATNGTPAGTRKLTGEAPLAESVGLVGGSYLWFTAPGGEVELWRTAGTPATTQPLVTDGILTPDHDDLSIPWAIRDGKLYFFRRQDTLELWTSDGTAAGTRLAARLPQVDSTPQIAASGQGLLYFFTARLVNGVGGPYSTDWAVWRSDGTAGGTRRLAALPGYALGVHATTRRLLFLSGGQLWASDGKAGGTSAIFGPPRDPALEIHLFLGAAGDKLYFLARTSGSTETLWVSDGTRRGTRVLSPAFVPVSSAAATVSDRIFFVAGDGVHGTELWSSRGTPGTTTLVTDLCPGFCSAFINSDRVSLAAAGGRIFFLADSPPRGRGLFVSDGTATGTRRLLDLCPGPCDSGPLLPEGGEVYFYRRDPGRGVELWVSDGTATGTHRVAGLGIDEPLSSFTDPTPPLTTLGSRVLTVGFDPQSGFEPWAFDRHGGGGQLLADTFRGGEPGSNPEDAVALGDRLLFKASSDEGKAAVWSTEGSAAITVKLGDVQSPWTVYNPPPSIAPMGARAYLNLGELWVTDGTPGGTVRLTALGAATGGRQVTSAIVSCTGQAVFAVSDASRSTELWSSDGTPAGTGPRGITLPFAIYNLTAAGEDLYFWGNDGQSGWEIWKADCTLSGIRRLTDLDDHLGLAPPGFARSGAFVYFLLPKKWGGSDLWRSDGTREGTAQVPNPGVAGVEQRPAAFLPREGGTLLLFTQGDRLRLWETDGTAAGTVLVRELDPDTSLQEVIPGDTGSVRFLVWSYAGLGFRLYQTDGTAQGTYGLIDFAGLGLGYVSHVTRAGGHLFFAAGSAWDDTELWTSDGTQETTRRFQEIAPGAQSSSPQPLAVAGSRLYLAADDGLHGRELWSLPLDDLAAPCRPSAVALCLGQGRFRAELFYHDRGNHRGDAYAVPWSASSGAFWFYGYGNPEAVVKLVDGTAVNGSPWVFFGPLTDAYLALTVTDVVTGEVKRYPGEAGPLPAFADLSPFALPAAPAPRGGEKAGLAPAGQTAPGPCLPTSTRLCLYDGRFALELGFRDETGVEQPARAFAHGDQAGYFAFGGGNDVEAAFKLLDGRALNGRFWLFAAVLTSREVTLTVTDTTDGTVHAFTKPPGPLASFIDSTSLR